MSTSTARQYDECDTTRGASEGPAWRPLHANLSDLVCAESPAGEIGPWMHARFAISLIHPRSVVRLESRRSVHVDNEAVLLVPELHMYSVRPRERESAASFTLLLDARRIPRLLNIGSPAFVARWDSVASTKDMVAEVSGSVGAASGAGLVADLVQRLCDESMMVALARTTPGATPLWPVRDYLRGHLGESVPTPTLAEMSGLTESHFIRAFHHEFGLPPHAYHMRLRLAHACELLARGESVATVAYDCGFADQSHLSRKFKEVYSVAPGAWPRVSSWRAAMT